MYERHNTLLFVFLFQRDICIYIEHAYNIRINIKVGGMPSLGAIELLHSGPAVYINVVL